jgi:hypothetical protein
MTELGFLTAEVRSRRLIPIRTKLLSFKTNPHGPAAIAKRVYVSKPPLFLSSKSPITDLRERRILSNPILRCSVSNPDYQIHKDKSLGNYTEVVRSSVEFTKNYDIVRGNRFSMHSLASLNTAGPGGATRQSAVGVETGKCTGPVSMMNEISGFHQVSESKKSISKQHSAIDYDMAELADIITPKNQRNRAKIPEKPLLLFITDEKTPKNVKAIEKDLTSHRKFKLPGGDALSRNRDLDPQGFQKMVARQGASFADYLELKMMLDRRQKNPGMGQLEELIKISKRKQAISFGDYKNMMDAARQTFRSPSLVPKPILSTTKRHLRAQSNGGMFCSKTKGFLRDPGSPENSLSPLQSTSLLKKSVTFSKYNTVFIFARDD